MRGVSEKFGISPLSQNQWGEQVIDGRWRIENQQGYGAFGLVFAARDQVSSEKVAVKIFNENYAASGYLQELGLMFDESHPNVVKTLSFGYTQGRKYIVYEFVHGGSLRDYLIRYPRVAPIDALRIMRQIVEGLRFAHSRQVVHRDLKPENILLTRPDWPFDAKLCDFGLSARRKNDEQLQTSYGSPAYMAPEQFTGGYDHRVDFYGAGVILYEMLFGRRPLGGDASSISYAHKFLEIQLPESGPPLLLVLLRKLLAKNPDDRYFQAEELLHDLKSAERELASVPSEGLPRPKLSQLILKERWKATLEKDIKMFMPAGHHLLFTAGKLVVAAGPEGKFLDVSVDSRTPTAFVRCCRVGETLAWESVNKMVVSSGGEHHTWPIPAEILESPHYYVMSPCDRFILAVTPRVVTLFAIDGEGLWRATVDTYGQLPPATFSLNGNIVWIATEAPRTQILALNIEGQQLCRTNAPGNEVGLIAVDENTVVVGARNQSVVHRMDQNGFVTASIPISEPILSLENMCNAAFAAVSMGHIEIMEGPDLTTRALVEHPRPEELTMFCKSGIFQVGLSPKGTTIRFSHLVER